MTLKQLHYYLIKSEPPPVKLILISPRQLLPMTVKPGIIIGGLSRLQPLTFCIKDYSKLYAFLM